MTSGVRFAAAHARMRALKSRLWTAFDRHLLVGSGVEPDGRPLAASPADAFTGLVRWYVTLMAVYPTSATLLRALFRRHEVENIKLLWRAAIRGRIPPAACWRPLEPISTLVYSPRLTMPQELVHQLEATPYGVIARALLRSHAADLPATEIGWDRWVWTTVVAEGRRLPSRERDAWHLIRALALEHDVELLRRGRAAGLDPDLVAKSTVVLSGECGLELLSAVAAWRPDDGALASVLPRALTRVASDARDWDDLVGALRAARRRQCRRAFVGWPYRLAPALAALLLREEQAYAAMRISAARALGARALAGLPLALAASALED
jgi:hypothetical protein